MTEQTRWPGSSPIIPRRPIDRIVGPLARFMHIETTSGAVLVLATLTALVLANSPAASAYAAFWSTRVELAVGSHVFEHSLKHLINDGLMAVFFFVIGLEVKREIVLGELKDLRMAVLPVAAAIGGMAIPAALFLTIEGDGAARLGGSHGHGHCLRGRLHGSARLPRSSQPARDPAVARHRR